MTPAKAGFFNDVAEACRGKNWLVRLPLLVLLAYLFWRYLQNPQYSGVFKGINLGVHELGHVVFAPLGEWWGIAGGTILQCLAPVISMGMFIRQKDYFALSFSFGWLSTNFFDVAVYVGDARAMVIPLVSPFGGAHVIHDWNYLLERAGLIAFDHTLAAAFRAGAIVSMVIGLLFGSWTLYQMHVSATKS